MKSNNPLKNILSFLLMFGPIILFWYVDWYWVFGYYNLYFTYTSYVLYKGYDNNPKYRKKYPLFVVIILPLLLGFIGLIISVVNGFEEIREGDKDFNKNQSKTNNKKVSSKNKSDLLNEISEQSIDDVHLLNKQFIEGLGKLNQSIKKEQYQKESFKLWKEFFEKQLNDYFKEWEEGYVSDDYEFEASEEGQFLIQDEYTTVKYSNDKVEYIHFKLIYNDENETEEGYLSIGFPFIYLDEIPYILFDFPHDYNHWTNNFGNHKGLFKTLSLNEVCEKLSKMKFINYKNWKITENNNPIDKNNEEINKFEKIKSDLDESKFSFNKVQALKQIDLNWIKGISPIYSVSLTELFENPGRTICYYKTDEESDFYEGEHISIIVKSISEGKDLIDFIINQNGENVSFMNIDNDRIIHKLGYLFDISLVEPEDFDFPIVEINRRKKLDYTSARGEEILHGIHLKSDSIKSRIKGFKKLILNNGEVVADGRYSSDSDAQKIDSWHSDFSTAFNDVNQVLEVNDPTNEFLKLNIEEAKNKIIDSGFSYKTENFEMNFYKGNSSWWVNFNLN